MNADMRHIGRRSPTLTRGDQAMTIARCDVVVETVAVNEHEAHVNNQCALEFDDVTVGNFTTNRESVEIAEIAVTSSLAEMHLRNDREINDNDKQQNNGPERSAQ